MIGRLWIATFKWSHYTIMNDLFGVWSNFDACNLYKSYCKLNALTQPLIYLKTHLDNQEMIIWFIFIIPTRSVFKLCWLKKHPLPILSLAKICNKTKTAITWKTSKKSIFAILQRTHNLLHSCLTISHFQRIILKFHYPYSFMF